MDAKTLTALKGSIEKWKGIVAGTEEDKGRLNCPLCHLFNPIQGKSKHCEGCPVMEQSGERGCCGTPYEKWDDYWYNVAQDMDNETPEETKLEFLINFIFSWFSTSNSRNTLFGLARAELKFLRSLLPEDRPEIEL
jgi:hypothetical protein